MDKSVIVNNKFDFVYVVDDKLVIAVHIKTLFFKIHFLRGCKLKIILLIGLHHLKYLEMIDVGEKYTPIISPGCYSKTKNIYTFYNVPACFQTCYTLFYIKAI